MQPLLPHQTHDQAKRRSQLENYREIYKFDYVFLNGIPFLDHVPKHEYFSLKYWIERLGSFMTMPGNLVVARILSLIKPMKSPYDFSRLFIFETEPEIGKHWTSNEAFNNQRNWGCNPQALRLMDEMPYGMKLDDRDASDVLKTETSLAELLKHKQLYLIEYPELAHIKKGNSWKGRPMTVEAPRAIFAWSTEDKHLYCLGIQLRPKENGRVFKPTDSENDWLAAKIAFQCADATHQELGTHFAWTHTVMIPFAVCTRRQLAKEHPIHIMLESHLTYYLFDNELGRTTFVNPGGPVDRMMGGSLAESIGAAAEVYHKWNLFDAAHPTELANRGLDDPENLPDYPFRDDGLLIWNALGEYVKAYIDLYYPDDQSILDDPELQAWAYEIASFEESEMGGKVKGMPSKIETKTMLTDILQIVIWTMAPLHSMLNFSQWDYIYAPNMPYALYDKISETDPISDADIMNLLPPYSQAAFQLKWNKILTSYHYDEFAKYKIPFADEAAMTVLQNFQAELEKIENIIDKREAGRKIKFPYFKPSLCINSINT